MKKCLHCSQIYNSNLQVCDQCHETPQIIDGFTAYAPSLAGESSGFKAGYFGDLAALEGENFWFRSRNKIITWAVETYASDFSSMLEVGCGTGFVLSGLTTQFPDAKFMGSEIFTSGLSFARQRLPSAELVQMDARQIPFSEEFDLIGAFDVLEHIKEDETVLGEVFGAIKSGGTLIASVPQHPWMWSAADDYACHERRYTACELSGKLNRAGFEILLSTSFVTLLLPPMVLSRLINRKRTDSYDPCAEMQINPSLNKFFEMCLSVELACIKRGLRFPVGGSRLVIARKPA